jgi:hypothetical protein
VDHRFQVAHLKAISEGNTAVNQVITAVKKTRTATAHAPVCFG